MEANRDTITTMGIISNEVYNSDYFTLKSDGTLVKDKIEGTNYKVLDHTPASDSSFNALLLQEEGTNKYVIAFRGTQEKFDIVDDIIIVFQGQGLIFD